MPHSLQLTCIPFLYQNVPPSSVALRLYACSPHFYQMKPGMQTMALVFSRVFLVPYWKTLQPSLSVHNVPTCGLSPLSCHRRRKKSGSSPQLPIPNSVVNPVVFRPHQEPPAPPQSPWCGRSWGLQGRPVLIPSPYRQPSQVTYLYLALSSTRWNLACRLWPWSSQGFFLVPYCKTFQPSLSVHNVPTCGLSPLSCHRRRKKSGSSPQLPIPNSVVNPVVFRPHQEPPAPPQSPWCGRSWGLQGRPVLIPSPYRKPSQGTYLYLALSSEGPCRTWGGGPD